MQLNIQNVEKLRKSARTLVREFGFFQTHYANTKATHGETHVLIELSRLGALEVGELSRILNMEKTSTSKLLSQMQRKGWVVHQRGADARKKIYKLSSKGKKVTNLVSSSAANRMTLAMQELPRAQFENIELSLELLAEALRISRAKSLFQLRKCLPKDDKEMASIVRRSIKDFGFEGPGTAAADASLNHLSAFNGPKSCFIVAEHNGRIFGGAGIAPMQGEPKNVCELVRMFLHPEARSSGLSQLLIDEVLSRAKAFKYKVCYLETTEAMQAAQRLYLKNGFKYVQCRRGNTGHFACRVFMEKKI